MRYRFRFVMRATSPPALVGLTDRVVRALPTLPTLGAANSQIVDPLFGATIIRVTDEDFSANHPDGMADRSFRTSDGTPQYGWSADSLKFIVGDTDGAFWLLDWNPTTKTASRRERLAIIGSVCFHNSDANAVYGRQGDRIIKKQTLTSSPAPVSTVVDADTLGLSLPNDGYIGAINIQNSVMMFSCGGSGSTDNNHYAIWYPLDGSTPKIFDSLTRITPGIRLHAVILDRTGRYVMLQQASVGDWWLWDTTADTVTAITQSPAGHACIGYETWVNNDIAGGNYDAYQWSLRNLRTGPNTVVNLVSPVLTPTLAFGAEHPTWHHAKATSLEPIVTATYRHSPSQPQVQWRAWDDEILSVATDGSNTVTRHGHHRSDSRPDTGGGAIGFWYTPRPNISPNGRWVGFTSNWEKSLGLDSNTGDPTCASRTDYFILERYVS